jgi:hypothetical protein
MKKTTIEPPDDLAEQARLCAAQQGTSMRSLIEDALRRELELCASAQDWTPRADVVFTGKGLTEAAAAMSWAEIREIANAR